MIIIRNLCKKFKQTVVIDDLCLNINNKEITALVGKNGSGKSTLIRLISGLLNPDSGTIEFEGGSGIGVLLGGDVNLYGTLTGMEHLSYFGKLRGLSDSRISQQINELDDVLNYSSFINNQCFTYSRGMRQKIAIAISMIHNPDILLLDEPSTGLDLEAANDVITFINYLKAKNKTILIATHNIFEIVDLSDQIAFIKDGKIKNKVKTSEFFRDRRADAKNSLLLSEME